MKASFAHLEVGRVKEGPLASKETERTGLFILNENHPDKPKSTDPNDIIASTYMISDIGAETGWEHLVVQTMIKGQDEKFIPHIPSIEFITMCKRYFWDDSETVVMYFSDKIDSVQEIPVVHLWRSKRQEYVLPSHGKTDLTRMQAPKQPENVEAVDFSQTEEKPATEASTEAEAAPQDQP